MRRGSYRKGVKGLAAVPLKNHSSVKRCINFIVVSIIEIITSNDNYYLNKNYYFSLIFECGNCYCGIYLLISS